MKVALTGGIAEGKSTVLARLEEIGLTVDSADRIARQVFETRAVNEAIAEFIDERPPVSPAQLRTALMIDPTVRRMVNALMHEPIVDRLVASSAQVIEVPLLYESCLQSKFEYVLVATCGPTVQRARLLARYGPEVDVEAILATQLDTRVKIAFADAIIRTDRPLDSVHVNIDSWAREAIA